MKKYLLLIWMALAIGFATGSQAQTASTAVLDREPELRQIDRQKDLAAVNRIEVVRGKLPAEFRTRNNFAWAVAKVEGLDKVEFFAHSGIQSLEDYSAGDREGIAAISLKPGDGQARFKTLCVNQNGAVEGMDCWQRNVDTEFKILEDMASRLPDTSVSGRMRLYTELYPCPSCWNVMKQFLALYPNVQMQVIYREP